MAIVYRTAGVWGAGKGSNLTAAEVDQNFNDLDTRLTTVEENPPEAVSIDHFTIVGNILHITLTNGVVRGPFVLPVAMWRMTGAWAPSTTYLVGDIVTNEETMYLVLVQHTSDETFDSTKFISGFGFAYQPLLSKPEQPYDIGMFFNDEVRSGEDLLMMHVAARVVDIPENFAGSKAWLNVATTDTTITMPIYKNTGIVGSLVFAPGVDVDGQGQYGTFATVDGAAIQLLEDDRLSIGQPYEDDSTASHLSVTIVGRTPALTDAS